MSMPLWGTMDTETGFSQVVVNCLLFKLHAHQLHEYLVKDAADIGVFHMSSLGSCSKVVVPSCWTSKVAYRH